MSGEGAPGDANDGLVCRHSVVIRELTSYSLSDEAPLLAQRTLQVPTRSDRTLEVLTEIGAGPGRQSHPRGVPTDGCSLGHCQRTRNTVRSGQVRSARRENVSEATLIGSLKPGHWSPQSAPLTQHSTYYTGHMSHCHGTKMTVTIHHSTLTLLA